MDAREMKLYYKKKSLILYFLIFVLFVAGCATTVSNIQSVDELKGNKLLVGRFVFYSNGKLVNLRELIKELVALDELTIEDHADDDEHGQTDEIYSGFSVLVKKEDGKTKRVELDEDGYIYIPVDTGKYHLTRINTIFMGAEEIRLRSSTGIKVNPSDEVVNLGIIKVEYKRSAASKGMGVFLQLTLSTGDLQPLYERYTRVIQTTDWDTTSKYIVAKFNILPIQIRDERIKFSKELEEPFK
jgi:hypothetical protein